VAGAGNIERAAIALQSAPQRGTLIFALQISAPAFHDAA